ncbi:MAG: hypothetical protein WCT04_12985 [Planctomycetota bacterium]
MTNTTSSTSEPVSSIPPAWRVWLSYVTVALMPLSINYERIFGPRKRPLYLSPLDFLLPILALFMVLDLIQRKPWARFKFPQVATILWSALAIFSYAWMKGGDEKLMDWVFAAGNPTFVVLLGVWVFSNLSDSAAEFRKLAMILSGSFAVCVLIAFYQYIGPVGKPFDPKHKEMALEGVTNMRLGGWYDNRMLFGAQAAMIVPVFAAFAALDKDPLIKALAGAFTALALCVTMAAGGFLGAVAGILAVAAACILMKKCWTGAALIVAVALFTAVVLPRLPEKRNNIGTLGRGVALWAKVGDDKKIATPRLRRYQATLSYLASHRDPMNEKSMPNWILGAGAGRYNAEVNNYFDDAYYPRTNGRGDEEALFDIDANERDGFGLVEKTGLELGAFGLTVLALFFAGWIFGAAGALARGESSELQVIALAALGAGVGAMFVSLFAFPSQRGAGSGGTFAFFCALAAWVHCKTMAKN